MIGLSTTNTRQKWLEGGIKMENYQEIARLIEAGLRKSVPSTRAVLQAIQLGYSLAQMEQKEKTEE